MAGQRSCQCSCSTPSVPLAAVARGPRAMFWLHQVGQSQIYLRDQDPLFG